MLDSIPEDAYVKAVGKVPWAIQIVLAMVIVGAFFIGKFVHGWYPVFSISLAASAALIALYISEGTKDADQQGWALSLVGSLVVVGVGGGLLGVMFG